MKLETIKKSKKKRILIGGLIILSLVSVITYTTTKAKYRSVQSVRLASGSVNFKGADISLVAINVSEDGTNYNSSTTLPEGKYELNTTMSKCRIPTETLTGENAPVDVNARIEYENRELTFAGITAKNTKCYVYLDKALGQTSKTIIAAIRKSIIYRGDNITPNFKNIAAGDGTISDDNSGVYRVADPIYKTSDNQNPMSYYFRGAIKNNYVKFGEKCWRIVRINGDGTIRLIYDGTTCHANGVNAESIAKTGIAYNPEYYNSSYVGWTYNVGSQRPNTNVPQTSGSASNIKNVTETWFNSDAGFTTAQKAQVATGKFCNDRATQNDETWRATGSTQYYAAYTRLYAGTKTPTLACGDGDIYHSQIGLITADEVQFAGASGGTNNASYYLFNGQYYWTMTPYRWIGHDSQAYMFCVASDGSLSNHYVNVTTLGLRPVINLKADTLFAEGGNGTIDNPYVVQENS